MIGQLSSRSVEKKSFIDSVIVGVLVFITKILLF